MTNVMFHFHDIRGGSEVWNGHDIRGGSEVWNGHVADNFDKFIKYQFFYQNKQIPFSEILIFIISGNM